MVKDPVNHFEIVYKAGKENINANALSRLPRISINTIQTESQTLLDKLEELRENQLQEPLFRNLIFYIEDKILPEEDNEARTITNMT